MTAHNAPAAPGALFESAFNQRIRPTLATQPAWLAQRRSNAIAQAITLGWPTPSLEDWRFTPITPLSKLPFHPAQTGSLPPGQPLNIALNPPFSDLPGPRLVFVNGHFQPGLSNLGGLPAGVTVSPLPLALSTHPALLEANLGRHSPAAPDVLTALNTAFFTDGAFIHVPDHVAVDAPVQCIHILAPDKAGTVAVPRNLIILGQHARLTLLETWLGVTGNSPAALVLPLTEIAAGDHSTLEWLKFQDEATSTFHLASLHGRFGRESRSHAHSFSLGAQVARTNIRTHLAGPGLECVLNGLYVTKGSQIADHHMVVDHAEPHCASHEYFNGILDDQSRGVFHGRILVRPIAQKTDAKQTNKNILLSDDATVDSKPQLEIYADDVKCTHGATIGQLNDESIFYLRARGIGLERARRMLIHAFAGEIINRVQHEATRNRISQIIWDRLESNPHVAESSPTPQPAQP